MFLIWSHLIFPFVLEASQVHDSLQKLSTQEIQSEWSSLEHRHLYKNPEVEAMIADLIDFYLNDPQSFQDEVDKLSPQTRKLWAKEDLDSRTDLIDLISIQLKLRMEHDLQLRYPEGNLAMDPSELWSLSKTRLKKVFLPEIDLPAGVSLFRLKGMKRQDFLLFCGETHQLGLEANKDLINWGHIRAYPLALTSELPFICGSENLKLSAEDLSATERLTPGPLLRKGLNPIRIHASLGITETISEFLLNFASSYIRFKGGYQLDRVAGVDFKKQLLLELQKADLFLPLIDMPNANEFNFSLKSEIATHLQFSKTLTDGRRIEFSLLLPPVTSAETKTQIKDHKGVRLTAMDLKRVLSARAEPFSIIDLSCFSYKYIPSWMSLFARPGNQKAPYIIASRHGHEGESPLQILMTLDLMLEAFEDATSRPKVDQALVLENLKNGSWLTRLVQSLRNKDPGFAPLTIEDPPFDDLRDFRESVMIVVEGKEIQLYPPIP